MRLLHTSDWHLGRIFHGAHLTNDQAFVLEQFVGLAKELKPDAVVIAGDVFDRAVPPHEAVALLDEVLSRLVLDLRLPVALIAGNHDSPDRIQFGARLLATQRMLVRGTLSREPARLRVADEFGPVDLFVVPYAEPATARERLGIAECKDHGEALRAALEAALGSDAWQAVREAAAKARLEESALFDIEGQELLAAGAELAEVGGFFGTPAAEAATIGELLRGYTQPSLFPDLALDVAPPLIFDRPPRKRARPGGTPPSPRRRAAVRRIAIAHAFVAGGHACDSERPLSVGGTGAVDLRLFDGFDYVALGHLHGAQEMAGGRVAYSGSPLKYSFSESAHAKSVSLVEIDAQGGVKLERHALNARRDVRRVRGTFADLLTTAQATPADRRDDYLSIELLDREPIHDAMGRLRAFYPNALEITRPYVGSDAPLTLASREARGLDELELFRSFFRQLTGEDLATAGEDALRAVVEKLRRAEREA